DGLPIRARAVGPVERLTRWARRSPAVAALSAALVLVALAGVSGVVWKWREAQRHADAAGAAPAGARQHAAAGRRGGYRADIVAASGALQGHNVVAARRALEDAPKELRDWEWRHFSTRLDTAQDVLPWGGAVYYHAHTTPDGRTVAVIARDGQVR